MNQSVRKQVAAGLVTILSLIGCQIDGRVGISDSEQAIALVNSTTAKLRAEIGADGRFNSLPANGPQERTSDEARALANAFARTFLPYIQTWLEGTRGAPIQPKSLTACGRPLFAKSSFQPIPASEPGGVRNGFGSYWLVTLCAGAEPQVSVAVAATRSGVQLEQAKIKSGSLVGGEFFAYGIPPGHVGEFPLPPEQAVTIVSETLGARVHSIAELVLPLHADGVPQNAKWVVDLDRSVSIKKSNGQNQNVQRAAIGLVLDGHGGSQISTFVRDSNQPSTITYTYPAHAEGTRAKSNDREVVTRIAYLRSDANAHFDNVAGRNR